MHLLKSNLKLSEIDVYHLLLICGLPEFKDNTSSPSVQDFSNRRKHKASGKTNKEDQLKVKSKKAAYNMITYIITEFLDGR